MSQIAHRESLLDAGHVSNMAGVLEYDAYFRMCETMVHTIGLELRPALSIWLEMRGIALPQSWPARLASWISARSGKKMDVSDFLELTMDGKAIADVRSYSKMSIPEVAERQLYLICRPTSEAAQAVFRPLRERAALAFNRRYLVGTPEQLAEWCGSSLRDRGILKVHLNFFDY